MPKSLARQDYEEAYRLLRLFSSKENSRRAVAATSAIDDLIWRKFGAVITSKAVLSFNAREMTEWKLMRLHNRLKNAAQRKAWGMKPFGKKSPISLCNLSEVFG